MDVTMQQCVYCIMDTTDPGIHFDPFGRCNRCISAEELGKVKWMPNAEGKKSLDSLIELSRRAGSRGCGKNTD